MFHTTAMHQQINKCIVLAICSLYLFCDDTNCQSHDKAEANPTKLENQNNNETSGQIKNGNPIRPRTSPPEKPAKFVLMPPFLIGACCVLVLYAFFHCVYMHCYTEKKVRTIATRAAAKTPTIIINDDSSSGAVQTFTPMVKYEAANGKTEIVEAHPFLICQPLPDESCESDTYCGKRKSLQLPKFVNKLRRPSKASSTFSGESSVDPESPREDNPLTVDRNRRTRASICFVPIGQSFTDPQNSETDWTPLHGFVYSSFVMPRRPSYKQACKSSESVGRMSSTSDKASTNSDKLPEDTILVCPSKASFMRSLSQPCETCTEQVGECTARINGSARKSSKVSFHLADNS